MSCPALVERRNPKKLAENESLSDALSVCFVAVHVAEQTKYEDPSHLEALEKETSILEKRVDACKSRIMMVTCFDSNVN